MNLRDKLNFWMILNRYMDIIVGPAVSPLSFSNAIADSLSYIKAYGGTEQSINVLPAGYKPLQYLTFGTDSYLGITDFSIHSTDKLEFSFKLPSTLNTALCNLFGGRNDGVAAGGGVRITKLASSNSHGICMYGFDTTDGYTDKTKIMQVNTKYRYIYNGNGNSKLYANETILADHSYTVNDTITDGWGINSYTANGGSTFTSTAMAINFYSLKIWNQNDNLILHYIPYASDDNSEVGIYDVIGQTFISSPTAGTWTAGPVMTTPTYDVLPCELKCNNGILKTRRQSGLPAGYTRLDRVINAANTKFLTGIIPDVDDLEVYVRCKAVTGSYYLMQSRPTGQSIKGFAGTQSNNDIIWSIDEQSVTSGITRVAGHILQIRGIMKNGNMSLWVKDETDNIEDTQTNTYVWADFSSQLGFLGNDRDQYIGANSDIYEAYIKLGGEYVYHVIPAKDSNGTVGLYDLVTDTLTTPSNGSVTAGSEIPDPYETYVDGLVETIRMVDLPSGYTPIDYIETVSGPYIDSGVTLKGAKSRMVVDFAVDASITGNNHFSGARNSTSSNAFYFGSASGKWRYGYGNATTLTDIPIDGDRHVIDMDRGTIRFDGTTWATLTPVDFTTPKNCAVGATLAGSGSTVYYGYAKIYSFKIYESGTLIRDFVPAIRNSDSKAGMYERVNNVFYLKTGSSEFVIPTVSTVTNTATCEDLLRINNYADDHSILDGVVTHNLAIKVLDGTETGWTLSNKSFSNSTLFADRKIEKSLFYCSHFAYNEGTTSAIPNGCCGAAAQAANLYFRNDVLNNATEWTTWLANQAKAGTPVIVIYPLATATTENVTAQTLPLEYGNSTLSIIQSSMDGLQLEAKYKQKA